MIEKINIFISQMKLIYSNIQDLVKVPGGLYVDLFGLVMIVRLLAVLKGFPPLSVSEAAVWGTTVGSLAYSNGGPKQS
jgi:hypothetical protein